jgi:hypothetical protein
MPSDVEQIFFHSTNAWAWTTRLVLRSAMRRMPEGSRTTTPERLQRLDVLGAGRVFERVATKLSASGERDQSVGESRHPCRMSARLWL